MGSASVVDGDTIEIHGERVRFNGIDAPDSTQLCSDGGGQVYHCGARSAEALSEWLAGSSPTICNFVERDQYGRFVGNCTRSDGASVQRWLVRNGYALDCLRPSLVPRCQPGAMALARTFSMAYSIASCRVKPTTPALLVA